MYLNIHFTANEHVDVGTKFDCNVLQNFGILSFFVFVIKLKIEYNYNFIIVFNNCVKNFIDMLCNSSNILDLYKLIYSNITMCRICAILNFMI